MTMEDTLEVVDVVAEAAGVAETTEEAADMAETTEEADVVAAVAVAVEAEGAGNATTGAARAGTMDARAVAATPERPLRFRLMPNPRTNQHTSSTPKMWNLGVCVWNNNHVMVK